MVSLAPLGLSEREEAVYRLLLRSGGGTLQELRDTTGRSRNDILQALTALETKALVARSASNPRIYVPALPDMALGRLFERRQQDLIEARDEAQRLAQRYRVDREGTEPVDLVEVISPWSAVAERARQLQDAAADEIICFAKAPLVVSPSDNAPSVVAALGRGVNARIVYDREMLEEPGFVDAMMPCIEAGLEVRIYHPLPMKLLIADRRAAVVPLNLESLDTVGRSLLVHRSSLLDALVLLWESVWARATPVSDVIKSKASGSGDELPFDHRDRTLVMLLLSGLKATAIARQLGVSFSTVERRTKRIMQVLGAETRFQAGFQVARHPAFEDISSK